MKKTYFILGAKWFDKVNGNTYFNARVIDGETGETLFYTGFQYGYGSQYAYEAREQLRKHLGTDEFNAVDIGSFYMRKREVKNGWF